MQQAFAIKGVVKKSSLGMLFIATQFVDILFFPFALAGIENLKFVKGFTAVNNFNMDYYPYTYGLLGTIGRYSTMLFVGFLLFVNYLNLFVLPSKEDIVSLTISALVLYFLFAVIAHFVEKGRK